MGETVSSPETESRRMGERLTIDEIQIEPAKNKYQITSNTKTPNAQRQTSNDQ
jgi:hypothetical protein